LIQEDLIRKIAKSELSPSIIKRKVVTVQGKSYLNGDKKQFTATKRARTFHKQKERSGVDRTVSKKINSNQIPPRKKKERQYT
jgi:hypothetical protein